MVPMLYKKHYDYAFVGSSPLSLLHALTCTEEGARILILNKENQLGGCWSWTSRDGLDYERAAHLIEALPRVYELLQESSGVRFVDAPIQPERQICGLLNFKMAYFSKFFLLAALAKIGLEFVVSLLQGPREQFINSRVKLRHWFSVNPALLVSRLPKLKVPETGYVSFVKGLVESCLEKGAEFKEACINECIDDGNIWSIKASNGAMWQAKHLIISSSVSMMETSEVGQLIIRDGDMGRRLSIILEIADEFKLRKFSYVSLFNHKLIRRVVDVTDKAKAPRGFRHYLFELSMKEEVLKDMSEDEIDALALSSGLFNKATSARLMFSSNFEYNITNNGLKSCDRMTVLDSFGNLAVGIKNWARL
jgi:hypothetical protein